MKTPVKNAGIVYLVGNAARLGTKTRISENMAPMINLKFTPCIRIEAMVTGKKMAVITVMEIAAHAMRFFSSFFDQFINRVTIDSEWMSGMLVTKFG
jgi:hypothetical protein